MPLLAVLLPPMLLVAWRVLLELNGYRRSCCLGYAPLEGSPVAAPPSVAGDLTVLAAAVLIGFVPAVALAVHRQLRRVRTSASTPPG